MGKEPLYPHVPKEKQSRPPSTSENEVDARFLAVRLLGEIEHLQHEAERVQAEIFVYHADAFGKAPKLNKRCSDAVDALSDIGVSLRTIAAGGRAQ